MGILTVASMPFDIRTALPVLIPKAIEWAETESSFITQVGLPLNETQLTLAKRVGVRQPELIRIAEVSNLPSPEDPDLRQAAIATGLLGIGTAGITLGYGIYVCYGHSTSRLLSHEFRHVYQYEQAGSFAAFLSVYLQQIVTYGYHNAPYEVDARAHETQALLKIPK
jgi:hypothetical protein